MYRCSVPLSPMPVSYTHLKMTVKITDSFDGSALGGQNLVTFEELYDMSNPKEPVKVAERCV